MLVECLETRDASMAMLGCPMYLGTKGNVPAVNVSLTLIQRFKLRVPNEHMVNAGE